MKKPKTRAQLKAQRPTPAETQRMYKIRLKKRGGRTINFACEKNACSVLDNYISQGYKTSDLLNYAISLLPSKMPLDT